MLDRFQDELTRSTEEQFIREAQDAETSLGKPRVAGAIVRPLRRLAVDRSVKLDNEARLDTSEINRIGSEWKLSPELEHSKLTVTQ